MLALEPAYLPLQPVQMHTRLSAAAELQPPAGWTGHEASCSIAALRSSFRPFPVRTKSASPPPSDKVVPAKRPRTATPVRTEVRMIRRDDVDPVMRLQNACLPIAYPLSFYTTLMASPTSICLAAFSAADSTTPVGFVAAQLVEPVPSLSTHSPGSGAMHPSIYILALSVAPARRRQGVAADLVRGAVDRLVRIPASQAPLQRFARLLLHVEAENKAAVAFYRRLGLETTGTKPNFYRGIRQGGGAADALCLQGIVHL
ncbi:hypothetical protein JCM8202_002298 [Rhodotorula sphaerocarpa]